MAVENPGFWLSVYIDNALDELNPGLQDDPGGV
jgi:hypothetical protein